jgi:hypothetical protein
MVKLKYREMIHVIMVAYERYTPLEIAVRSFMVQSNPDWVLHVVYDGQAPQGILDIVNPLIQRDGRIHFYQSAERYQAYGHPNRRSMLQSIQCSPTDFVLMTNDDNYYVPKFIEWMLKFVDRTVGLVYCDTVHSHMEYDLHRSEIKENFIDIGAFIVRADVAKQTGFNHDHFSADGVYAEECAATCRGKGLRLVKVAKPLFVHN